jgi:hypothetical protein
VPKVTDVASEASLQRAVTGLCTWLGIWWWHDTDPRRNKAGLPDLIIVGDHGILWRELKSPRGRLRPGQDILGRRLRASGQDWDTWRPADWASGRIKKELESIR